MSNPVPGWSELPGHKIMKNHNVSCTGYYPMSPNTALRTKSDKARSPNTATSQNHQTLPTQRKLPLIVPRKKNEKKLPLLDCSLLICSFPELFVTNLFLYWTMPGPSLNCPSLKYSFTKQCLYWNILLLNCSFTKVFTGLFLYWASPLVTCPFTEVSSTKVLLYWTIPSLNCPFQSYSFLNCSFTKLLLYWSVKHWTYPLLNCSFTGLSFPELFLYCAVPSLTCPFAEVSSTKLLYWTYTFFTELSFPELFLCWAVPSLNFCFTEVSNTELILYWTVPLLS